MGDADDHHSAIETKITETFHDNDSSSSEDENGKNKNNNVEKLKANVYRIFSREKPLHIVLGGGKAADIFLWRQKKVTAGLVGLVTAVWVLFELLQYHLLTLVCHLLLLGLAFSFLWSRASSFINNKSPPPIPDVFLPEDIVLQVAAAFRIETNRAFFVLREIALGKDLKKFIGVISGLWIISVLGSSFSFLTLFYIAFMLLHTVPFLYERYEDQVDAFAEKAEAEIKKQYAVFEAKVLSKVPIGPLKGKVA
ncbi:membrane traffic protein [Lithospermum erythrorhizon]|uniref:Reticulon-like protein n=1 Tax=Lithospermum erythrorhizon TaxID=34254 RepID=A0AAV3R7A8_LITER